MVRIEDLDGVRCRPQAASDILATLDGFGFEWEGPVLYQSKRLEVYCSAVAELLDKGLAYPCTCSRRQVAEGGSLGVDGAIYPGTCRNRRSTRLSSGSSLRVCTTPRVIRVADAIQGPIRQQIAREVGDFVIQRADRVYAYQLAVVVDDAEQGITQVVRGADLWVSTPRQVYLQRLLGLPTPSYAHHPVVVDRLGRKLSKSEAAAPLDRSNPLPALLAAWTFLGQERPPEWLGSQQLFWTWARAHWRLDWVPPLAIRPIADILRSGAAGAPTGRG